MGRQGGGCRARISAGVRCSVFETGDPLFPLFFSLSLSNFFFLCACLESKQIVYRPGWEADDLFVLLKSGAKRRFGWGHDIS